MARPTHDEYFLMIAKVVAGRSTCLRRAVGCVLVDGRHHILATGYNGVAAGQPHCNQLVLENPSLGWTSNLNGDLEDGGGNIVKASTRKSSYPHACPGATAASGTYLDSCQAIHAEQNALVQCRDAYQIETVYCTVEPCVSCTKLLLGTSARRVVFAGLYPGSGRDLWAAARGRDWLAVLTSASQPQPLDVVQRAQLAGRLNLS